MANIHKSWLAEAFRSADKHVQEWNNGLKESYESLFRTPKETMGQEVKSASSRDMVAFIGKDNGDGTTTFPNSEVRRMYAEIEKLRLSAAKALKIIEVNLYRQREKVDDAKAILRDMAGHNY